MLVFSRLGVTITTSSLFLPNAPGLHHRLKTKKQKAVGEFKMKNHERQKQQRQQNTK